jgi:hypothetical protein
MQDNGIGRDKAATLNPSPERSSLATQITRERVAVLNQQLNTKIEFKIEDILDENAHIAGTQVIFLLPLIRL